jgi:hypothetical protein
VKHYINFGSVAFFINITFSETIFQNETHIRMIQDTKDGFSGMEIPEVFANGILISKMLNNIDLTEETQIDLGGLTHLGKKIVAVKYVQVQISGEDRIAIKFINYKSNFLSVKMTQPINMPVNEPEYDEKGNLYDSGQVSHYEYMGDEEFEIDVNLIIDEEALLILPLKEFVRRQKMTRINNRISN